MTIGDYELRLAGQKPPDFPVNAVWKADGQWLAQVQGSYTANFAKVRLLAGEHPAMNFNWSSPLSLTQPTPVPAEIAQALDSVSEPGANLSLCDSLGRPLVVLPVVNLEAKTAPPFRTP
jgi:hypothetical protein